jgi:hypothetical protein
MRRGLRPPYAPMCTHPIELATLQCLSVVRQTIIVNIDSRERAEILTVMNMALWAMPCGPFSTPRMEAVVSPQKLVNFYQKTWRHITDNRACLNTIYIFEASRTFSMHLSNEKRE